MPLTLKYRVSGGLENLERQGILQATFSRNQRNVKENKNLTRSFVQRSGKIRKFENIGVSVNQKDSWPDRELDYEKIMET